MAWKSFGNSFLQVSEQWQDDEDDEQKQPLLPLACWSHPVHHLVVEFSLLEMPEKVGRPDFWMADLWLVVSVTGPTTRSPVAVSAWVSDGAEGTGDALVVVETDAVTTG